MMNPLDFDLVQTAMTYWTGALSEPVPIIDRDDMALAVARGAVVWDVRAAGEPGPTVDDRVVSLGSVDWLLAESDGGNLIPADVIADVLHRAGIQRGSAVIVYAEQHAVDAFVALRALRSIGVADARICLGDGRPAAPAGRLDAITQAGGRGTPGRPAARATASSLRL